MISDELFQTLLQQMKAVRALFPDLCLEQAEDGRFVVRGSLGFQTQRDGKVVEAEYEIEINIPDTYPQSPPVVRETGGKIPEDFHTNGDTTRCLGVPLEVRMRFSEHATLIHYLTGQVVPFLFSHAYFSLYGDMPFGERPHGAAGLLDFYKELLGVEQDLVVLGFLRILADDDYKGHVPCPCGRGLILRKCHGQQLREARDHQRASDFLNEWIAVFKYLVEQAPNADYRGVVPKRIMKAHRRRAI
ncbi:MAG TPA: hypothetical protein VM487_11465 [Phycisphaerae bacterium]|nr:hypothetical protein [Phycisphaerae bacterium]